MPARRKAGSVRLVADRQLRLVGRPDALRGELEVTNTRSSREVVRSRLIAGSGDAALRAHRDGRLKAFSLRPNETRTVPVSLRLDRHTPPGEYQVQVEVAGRSHDAVVNVLAVPRLRLEPRVVTVANQPGESVPATVFARNDGNVPLEIGEIGGLVLEDDVLACRILRRALAEFDEATDTYEDFLTETVRQAKRTLEELGPLRVHHTAGPVVVEPGRTERIDLEITVPSRLQRRGRYATSTRLHGARLRFVVAPPDHAPATPADEEQPA